MGSALMVDWAVDSALMVDWAVDSALMVDWAVDSALGWNFRDLCHFDGSGGVECVLRGQ